MAYRYLLCRSNKIKFRKDFYENLEKFEVWEMKLQNYMSIKDVVREREEYKEKSTEMFRRLINDKETLKYFNEVFLNLDTKPTNPLTEDSCQH